MPEEVRFYWLRGEGVVPFNVIPAHDRTPLRVHRSVLQAHAPEAIKRLEEGRYIVAVWPSSGQILLIGCHPNVLKGGDDSVILDTSTLPRLVTRLDEWSQAPELARIFLRAFGSEVASAEEGVEARRDLQQWLTGHGQPDMAAVVRHYSSFPFDIRTEALDVINSWRHVLIKGPKQQLDRFMMEADRRFGAIGWEREEKFEGLLNRIPHQVNRFYCWVSPKDSPPRIMLCLNRTTDRRVRGGTYDILDGRPGLADLAIEIQRVLRDVLEPAAADMGLDVTYPRLGPISRVGPKTMAVLTAIAEAAEGQWPLPAAAEPLWNNFVITAVHDDVAIKPDELIEWFIASGWSKDDAVTMANRFYAEAAKFGEYEEAGRQPA